MCIRDRAPLAVGGRGGADRPCALVGRVLRAALCVVADARGQHRATTRRPDPASGARAAPVTAPEGDGPRLAEDDPRLAEDDPRLPRRTRRWYPTPRGAFRVLVWTAVVTCVGGFAASLAVPAWYGLHNQQ